MRSYAIGDIHGHLDKLTEAHKLIADDRRRYGNYSAPVVHLGDLVDRGPDSAGVIAFLRDGIAQGQPWVVLKGNHDRMMELFLHQTPMRDPYLRAEFSWLSPQLGGLDTLISYGVVPTRDQHKLHADALRLVPRADVAFLASRPTSLYRGPVFFAHAGIRPGVPLEMQTETDLLWIRGEFHASQVDHGALIVHGHTPIDAPTHYGNRVNLDSGAAFGGPLTAAVFEDLNVWTLVPGGRIPLRP